MDPPFDWGVILPHEYSEADVAPENYDPGVTYDENTVPRVGDGYNSDNWRVRTPEEKKRDDIIERKTNIDRARSERNAAWIRANRPANWADTPAPSGRDLTPRERQSMAITGRNPVTGQWVSSRYLRVPRGFVVRGRDMTYFTEPFKYPEQADVPDEDYSILLGGDPEALEEICDSLHPEQKVQLGYIALEHGKEGSLKNVTKRLFEANNARVNACNKVFAQLPESMFRYYRVTKDLDETLRSCSIFGEEVIDKTEMLQLPCGHSYAVQSLYEMFVKADKEKIEEFRVGFACWFCRQGNYCLIPEDDKTTPRFDLRRASGGGQHLLDDCLHWFLCGRPEQYNMAYHKWVVNGMQGPMPPAPENTSQLTIREATEPAAASTTPCSPSGAVVVSAEATPTPEAPSGLVVGLADASQPATGSVPDEDVDMDEASDDAAYGIKRLNDMGDITLYQMPNCTCILGSDAVLKYMDWVAANLSEDAVPTCPVQGCGTPLNALYDNPVPDSAPASPHTTTPLGQGPSLADRVTLDAQGHAVRVGSIKPTPFNDRDYSEPPAMVTGKYGGEHTKISYSKIAAVKQSCKVNGQFDKRIWQKKIGKMHKKDNWDRRMLGSLPPVEEEEVEEYDTYQEQEEEEELPKKKRKMTDRSYDF